jgi:hypothetical protein
LAQLGRPGRGDGGWCRGRARLERHDPPAPAPGGCRYLSAPSSVGHHTRRPHPHASTAIPLPWSSLQPRPAE